MTRPNHCIVAACSALALLALSSPSSAEEGELQVGVATPFLLHTRTTSETKFEGVKTESKGSGTSWGIGHSVLGEIGYGVTPMVVFGGLFQIAGSSDNDDEDGSAGDFSTRTLLLGPKVDLMFLPGDKVQPFVGGVLALSSAFSKFGSTLETTATGIQLMGRAGIRAFPNSKFSLDPQLLIGQGWASGETTSGDAKADTSVSAFQIGVLLGISGWI